MWKHAVTISTPGIDRRTDCRTRAAWLPEEEVAEHEQDQAAADRDRPLVVEQAPHAALWWVACLHRRPFGSPFRVGPPLSLVNERVQTDSQPIDARLVGVPQ